MYPSLCDRQACYVNFSLVRLKPSVHSRLSTLCLAPQFLQMVRCYTLAPQRGGWCTITSRSIYSESEFARTTASGFAISSNAAEGEISHAKAFLQHHCRFIFTPVWLALDEYCYHRNKGTVGRMTDLSAFVADIGKFGVKEIPAMKWTPNVSLSSLGAFMRMAGPLLMQPFFL